MDRKPLMLCMTITYWALGGCQPLVQDLCASQSGTSNVQVAKHDHSSHRGPEV